MDSPTSQQKRRPTGPQAVIFCGIQATGKSSFFRERFADTHIRINLDMLKTRHRETRLLEVCCAIEQSFVVDNTNPGRADRARYIDLAREAEMAVVGYYFSSEIGPALERNARREGARRIPDAGVKGTHSRLEVPSLSEGFDELFYVRLTGSHGFEIEPWDHEV